MEHAMMDMGHKMTKETGAIPIGGKDGEDKMMYPTMHLDHKVPPEMMSKDVGHMCRMEIVAKIVSKSENDTGNSMSLEIHKMGHIADAGKKTFAEYEKMSKEEKEEHDKHSAGTDEKEEEEY